jgi:hypothetical protein
MASSALDITECKQYQLFTILSLFTFLLKNNVLLFTYLRSCCCCSVLSAGSGYEVGGVGEDVETISLRAFGDAAVVGGVKSLFSLGGQLVVATGYGVFHRLTWEGKLIGGLGIHLDQVSFSNDCLAFSAKDGGGESSASIVEDVCYSPELHGMAVVMGNGRAAFLTSQSARFEPSLCQAAWLKDVTDAVCTTINTKYNLLTFGRENGTVAMLSSDDSTGEWALYHTLQFTKQQFPETSVLLGRVQSMQWSHDDQTVLAVSWQHGGLSLWSVFGSLLLCSLGDQPGTPSPLNPHCTVLESLTWSSDGYHLWMLPVDARAKSAGADTPEARTPLYRTTGVRGHLYGNREQLLVMRFLKNSVVTNPILANHSQLLLQGCDRLYLNSTTTTCHTLLPSQGAGGGATSHLSSPLWKILLLPPSYLVLNWPLRYAAVDEGGCNLAVAGRAGFALYSGVNRKWKLFGNEVQEQAMMCRGGLLWHRDIVIFPCRVQEKYEEIRFYWLQSNLDNSRVLHILKLLSPVVKVNVYGNYLVVATRDGHITIYHLSYALLPTRGLVLSVSQVHEFSVAKSVPQPWAHTLVSLTPSSIRTEPGIPSDRRRPIDSILLNVAGRLLMLQQDPVNPYVEDKDTWQFNHPVCLVQGVEMIWTPSPEEDERSLPQQHLMESLWLACGAAGIKVWLPLYPRDEGRPTFLSKRIMLTLNILVYPQVVLFRDAILFGLSHETALTEASISASHSFPFATVERTTHVYLHLILRKLLRRNLGSHALQIARSCSHLPYFAHVLELMLHEVLEEEAPGSMPVPDALLPRVVEFIKQFPQFLETIGSCARKTEVALWQYLFAAVDNPRDLFELCITDGRLKTAACYLIIIQNLEPVTVSRQLATRLLDAALDSNQWELCKDLVRFLRAIGPGDMLDSVTRDSTTPVSAHFPKTPRAPPTPPSTTGTTPSLPGPDLDRSAISMAQDHLTSGSTSSTVSLSGDFRDASGKVIRRPQFVLDMESKEEYFIELILSRHARKLLTATCLRDLGKFAAHLDFNLEKWLARERLRAARIDNLLATVRQLHKEFQWPLPPSDSKPTPTPVPSGEPPSRLAGPALSHSSSTEGGDSPNNKQTFSPDSDTASVSSSLRRPHRPPDLDLSSLNLTPISHQDITIHTSSHPPPPLPDDKKGAELTEQAPPTTDINEASNRKGRETSVLSSATDLDPTRSSTPLTAKMSGSVSEKVSLVPVSQKHCTL